MAFVFAVPSTNDLKLHLFQTDSEKQKEINARGRNFVEVQKHKDKILQEKLNMVSNGRNFLFFFLARFAPLE